MVKENTMMQTEIGLLPEEWEVIRLGDYVALKNGYAFPSVDFSDKGPIVMTPGNFKLGGGLKFNANKIIRFKGSYTKNMQFSNGDLVMVMTDLTPDCNLLGKAGIIDTNEIVLHNQRIGKIECSKNIHSEYLCYYFNSETFSSRMKNTATGSTVRHTSTPTIKNTILPLPPLPEQEAIAEALSDADAWIESLEQLISKKRLIKQGAMQELLSPKEDWGVKKLGEVTIDGGLIRGPFGGALKKEFFVKNGYKVYEQKNAIYKSVHLGKYFVDTAKFKELGRFEIKANDFILSCSGTIGKLFRIPQIFQKGIINQALLIIRLNSTIIDFGYFGHIFQYDTIQSKIIDDTQGGAMKNLVGMSEFRNIEIPLPSLTEQIRIATILSDMDAALEALKGQLGKAIKVKQGMMQELLTGRVRLV